MNNKLSELPSPAPNDMDSLVAMIRNFVVWIGGSLASITAVFYATGYLITRAHLNMLGLYGVLDFDSDHIVQEGGKFFLVVGYTTLSNVALPLFVMLGVAVIAVRAMRLRAGSRAQRWGRRLRDRLPGFCAHGWTRLLAFAVLFGAFLWHSEVYLLEFQYPLCIDNLLYADSGRAPCAASMMANGANALKAALLRRDERLLDNAFEDLLFAFALAAALSYLTWRITLPWRWRNWYVAPSFIATAMYLVLLPMDYGVLQRPVDYPRIALTLDADLALPTAGPLFLINQTAHDLVVWDASLRKLYWIPAGSVRRAEVDGTYSLFDPARYQTRTQGAKR